MIILELNKKIETDISEAWCQKVARQVDKYLKNKKNLEVSVAVVNDQEIKKWNRLYRKLNQPTDVLSFSGQEGSLVPGEDIYLGEIIISWPRTKAQAKKSAWPVKNEFTWLLIHGLLHLFGYDHEKSPAAAKKMHGAEKNILAKLGIKHKIRV